MTLAPWNEDAWLRLQQRRERGSLPHAILLGGPAGLRKREFADAFAAAMLCQTPTSGGHACGNCRACRLFAAGTHPDLVRVNLELRDDSGGSEQKRRTEITVDQMRSLSERLGLTAQFGGAQIALIDPADTLNVNASNALLKTLEEPTPGTIIVLVADQPSRLSATIRSRCQRIDFRIPPVSVALAWLLAQDVDKKQIDDALRASEGNPGMALSWLNGGAMKVRAEVARDLVALNCGSATAYDVAQRWSRDNADLRLHFAASLTREQAMAELQARGNAALALTSAVELTKLTAWFERANRTRELLRGPLRQDLALLELLADWTAVGRGAMDRGFAR